MIGCALEAKGKEGEAVIDANPTTPSLQASEGLGHPCGGPANLGYSGEDRGQHRPSIEGEIARRHSSGWKHFHLPGTVFHISPLSEGTPLRRCQLSVPAFLGNVPSPGPHSG